MSTVFGVILVISVPLKEGAKQVRELFFIEAADFIETIGGKGGN